MKKILFLAAAVTVMAASPIRAADIDVGVSIGISQPGVYGRIDIGRFPQPQVVYAQPMIVARPVVVQRDPVYMWVPPGHRKDWKRHCRDYQACGVPVVFVRDDWYDSHVRPSGRGDDRGYDKGRGKGHGKGQGKGRHDD